MATLDNRDNKETMVWIKDNDCRKYSCYTCDLGGECDIRGKLERKEDLTEQEKIRCMDVSNFIGETRP